MSNAAKAMDERDPVIDDLIADGENDTPLVLRTIVWISLLDPVAIKSVKPSALTSAKAKLVKFPEVRLIVMGLPKLPAPSPYDITMEPAVPVVAVATSRFPSLLRSAKTNPVYPVPERVTTPALVNEPLPFPKYERMNPPSRVTISVMESELRRPDSMALAFDVVWPSDLAAVRIPLPNPLVANANEGSRLLTVTTSLWLVPVKLPRTRPVGLWMVPTESVNR